MNIRKSHINLQNTSFSGHTKKLDKAGYATHDFFYLYDKTKYEKCEVEVYNINKDKNGNFSVGEKAFSEELDKDTSKTTIDIDSKPEVTSDIGFAYRFKLTEKGGKKVDYAFDNGTVIGIFGDKNVDKFNVILNNRAMINKNGAMQLIMPDEYYPGVENVDGKPTVNEALRAKALASVRTHANKLGGNFFGIVKRLPQLEQEGIRRIVGTPFTKDTISSHLYWTENAYRVAPTLGTEEEFKTLQEELFKHGINWIADAALVNEGFGGIHMSELLRRGSDSVSKNMFRTKGDIALGILPDKSEFTRMKIINAPFVIGSDGTYRADKSNYDSSKPTYIQFYDERLASKEQVESDSPMDMTTYANKNTDNVYDITKHDDAVYPFPIEVSPSELKNLVSTVAKANGGKVDLSDVNTIKKVTKFSNFSVETKSNAAGIEVWDGNVDIAKLNFYRCDKDDERFLDLPDYQKARAIEEFDRGALAVRDYAVNSGKYWTKLAADTQLAYASKLFNTSINLTNENSVMRSIRTLSDSTQGKNTIPSFTTDVVDLDVVKNVLAGNYHSRLLDDADIRADINPESYEGNDYTTEDYILRHSMDVPLETLPVATNLLGVLTSPYIAKKANTSEELGVSRYDLYSAENPNLPEQYAKVYSQMDSVYSEQLAPMIQEIVSGLDGVTDDDGSVTDFGKYILNEVTPDLTKYLLTMALNPNANISVDNNGQFDFSSVKENEITMQSIGIPFEGKTLEQEAQIAVKALSNGLDEIPSEKIALLKQAVNNRFSGRDENSFRIAEMILDRTESGLGWRIDAAKDIASIDSVRADVDSMTDAWNNVIDFWKMYNQTVLGENPHAYTTAEITDLSDLFTNETKTMFTSDGDAERKFLEETGITSVANYNFFFSLLPDLFAPLKLEAPFGDTNGWQANQEMNKALLEKMHQGWSEIPGFLYQSPDDGVVNSYTFVGNHDKPRLLHLLSLDKDLFDSDFSSLEHRTTAAKVLNPQATDEEIAEIVETMDFDAMSSKAIAMGARLNEAFAEVVTDQKELAALNEAVSKLASGEFKGKKFDSDAFGTRPIEIALKTVIEEAGDAVKTKDIESKVLSNILVPAFDRFRSIYKLLVTIPGSPTDFAGDRVGVTGFETKAKNYHQQNRNVIHWEWLDKTKNPEFAFVRNFYDDMNEIANLRNKKELSALNNGSTITVKVPHPEKDETSLHALGLIRYNDKGSVVLTLHNSTGASNNFRDRMDRTYGKQVDEKTGKPVAQSKRVAKNVISNASNKLYLSADEDNNRGGLKHGLSVDDVFYNARYIDTPNKDKEIYTVKKDAKGYYIEKTLKGSKKPTPLTIEPEDLNTLVLYKP